MSELYAFPQGNEWMDHEGNMRLIHEGGMTLRDYFAGQFLSGAHASLAYLAKDEKHTDRSAIAAVVIAAYAVADAMLAERKSHEADRAFKEAL